MGRFHAKYRFDICLCILLFTTNKNVATHQHKIKKGEIEALGEHKFPFEVDIKTFLPGETYVWSSEIFWKRGSLDGRNDDRLKRARYCKIETVPEGILAASGDPARPFPHIDRKNEGVLREPSRQPLSRRQLRRAQGSALLERGQNWRVNEKFCLLILQILIIIIFSDTQKLWSLQVPICKNTIRRWRQARTCKMLTHASQI